MILAAFLMLVFRGDFRREHREVGKHSGSDKDRSSDDVRHGDEFNGSRELAAEDLGHEGDVFEFAFVFHMVDDAGSNNGEAVQSKSALEQEGVEFLDDVSPLSSGIGEAGKKDDKSGNQSEESDEAGFGNDVLRISEFTDFAEVKESENTEDDGNGSIHRKKAGGHAAHDFVRVSRRGQG